MEKIQLSLKSNGNEDANGANETAPQAPQGPEKPEKSPVIGWFAVAFGFLGIFTYGVIFVPLGFAFSLIALFTGQALWGFIGLLINVIGLLTSPHLWLLIGGVALYHWADSIDFLQPFMDLIGAEPPSEGEDV